MTTTATTATTPDAPVLLDARHASQPHHCAGMWTFTGANAGGHEIYRCDLGRHVIIAAHANRSAHECRPQCAEPVVLDRDGLLARARSIGALHAAGHDAQWDMTGDESALLMDELGQMSPTTEANATFRSALCDAYDAGYEDEQAGTGLGGSCPDCGAKPGEPCSWNCSSNWK